MEPLSKALRVFPMLFLVMTPVLLRAQPAVFWASDPVAPGQTVLLTGHGLGQLTGDVTVQRLADDAPGLSPTSQARTEGRAYACAALQPSNEAVKFILPGSLKAGMYRYAVPTVAGTVSGLLNRPVIWWTQGDLGEHASPGGELRLFGKNLLGPGKTAAVLLRGPESLRLEGTGTTWALRVKLPATLREGRYQVFAHSGWGGPAVSRLWGGDRKSLTAGW